MKSYLRGFIALFAIVACVATAYGLGADFSEKDITAQGKHCVHGYWVNELTAFYYRGDAAAFNEHIKKLDDDQIFPITWASRKVILHIGPKKAESPWDKAPRDKPCDWKVMSWIGEEPPANGMHPMHRQIDIWLGGNLKLDDLRIPASYEVVSGGEIDAFLKARKKPD